MRIEELILGGPGAGKTEALLRVVEKELAAGVPPERLALVAFTNAAADEARDRVAAAFGLTKKQLKWFRTIHSLAFEALGLLRQDVLQGSHWRELGDMLGLKLSGFVDLTDGPMLRSDQEGERLLSLHELASAQQRPLRDVWQERGVGVSWQRLEQLAATLDAYKRELGLVSFSDMLQLFLERGLSIDVDVALIDEAQDLTRAQWLVVEAAFADAQRVYLAGDDDQAIYAWAGADVERFLSLRAKTRVLPVSHRLPRVVFQRAAELISQVGQRYAKAWGPADREGALATAVEPGYLPLAATPGPWLLLGRNRQHLKRFKEACLSQGVPFSLYGRPYVNAAYVATLRRYEHLRAGKALPGTELDDVFAALELDPVPAPYLAEPDPERLWTAAELGLDVGRIWHDALTAIPLEEREFYLTCLRRGEDLIGAPRVRISTIHGAKGQEADHVALGLDLSPRTHAAYIREPEIEHRVFYVGCTRARETLTFVLPRSSRAYEL